MAPKFAVFLLRAGQTPPTDEKRSIRALWEKASGGKGLFLMAEKQVDGKDVRGQMLAKVR